MTHPCQPTVCGNAALASHVYKSNRVDVDKRYNEVGEGRASAHLYGIQFFAIIQAVSKATAHILLESIIALKS